MKTITKEIQKVEKIIRYVSADGKEWENAKDCEEWEKGVRCVTKANWNNMIKIEISSVDTGVPYNSDEHSAYMVMLRDENDIVTLVNYEKLFCCDNRNTEKLDNTYIGIPLIVEFGYDEDWVDVYKAEKHLNNIVSYITMHMNNIKELYHN